MFYRGNVANLDFQSLVAVTRQHFFSPAGQVPGEATKTGSLRRQHLESYNVQVSIKKSLVVLRIKDISTLIKHHILILTFTSFIDILSSFLNDF